MVPWTRYEGAQSKGRAVQRARPRRDKAQGSRLGAHTLISTAIYHRFRLCTSVLLYNLLNLLFLNNQ